MGEWDRTAAGVHLLRTALARRPLRPARRADVDGSRLIEERAFGSNPGELRMFSHVPATAGPSPALVVVLHGCTQTAAGYDIGAGWSTLAERHGFAVLFPEQRTENNPNRCFNWFQQEDAVRSSGEALSIRQMVAHMAALHGIDPARVFVTGLSAGGAMTNVMLATYPDVFAGGAVIAGLPYGCAHSVMEAFGCMAQAGVRSAAEWGDLVRDASPHRGPWPKVSIWHGTADTTVRPQNAVELTKQWTNVHGLASDPTWEDQVNGYPHHVWTDAAGAVQVEEFVISGMAHGTPLATTGADAAGAAGAFLLETGISSSAHIARFWGIAEPGAPAEDGPAVRLPAPADVVAPEEPSRAGPFGLEKLDIGAVINGALKAAGLMR